MGFFDFLGGSAPDRAKIDPFFDQETLQGRAGAGAAGAEGAMGAAGQLGERSEEVALRAGSNAAQDQFARRDAQQGLGDLSGNVGQRSGAIGAQQQQIRQQAQGQMAGSRGAQGQAMGLAQQAAMGRGPSAAQAQMQAGQDAAAAQQFAMAQSGGAAGEAARMRQAARNAGQQSAQAANQSAQLAAQEQQAGQQLFANTAAQARAGDAQSAQALGQLAGQQRGQVLDEGQVRGGLLGQQGGLAAQGQGMQLDQLSDARQRQLAAAQTQGQLGLGLGDQAFQQFMGPQQANVGAENAAMGRQSQFVGGLFGAGGGIAASLLSDEREKVDVEDGSEDVRGFLDTLEPHTYAYRDPSAEGAAPGRRFGIMAQDLERSTAGRSVVQDGPDGRKRVDVPQATGLALAGLGDLHRRIAKLEGRSA